MNNSRTDDGDLSAAIKSIVYSLVCTATLWSVGQLIWNLCESLQSTNVCALSLAVRVICCYEFSAASIRPDVDAKLASTHTTGKDNSTAVSSVIRLTVGVWLLRRKTSSSCFYLKMMLMSVHSIYEDYSLFPVGQLGWNFNQEVLHFTDSGNVEGCRAFFVFILFLRTTGGVVIVREAIFVPMLRWIDEVFTTTNVSSVLWINLSPNSLHCVCPMAEHGMIKPKVKTNSPEDSVFSR